MLEKVGGLKKVVKAEKETAAGAEKLPEGIGLAGVEAREPVPVAVPSKRWDKEAYNAYKREYMRKRRKHDSK